MPAKVARGRPRSRCLPAIDDEFYLHGITLHPQLLRQLQITLCQVATVTDLPAILLDLQQTALLIPGDIRLPARYRQPTQPGTETCHRQLPAGFLLKQGFGIQRKNGRLVRTLQPHPQTIAV